jgi:hypothetical protein
MELQRRTNGDSTALNVLRFTSVMSTAAAMTAAVAHLLERPNKRRYEAPLYVRLHRTLYNNFGRFAGPAEALAVVTTGALAARLRQRRSAAYPLTAAAAGSVSAAHGIFWSVVNPVNVEMQQWPLDRIPAGWSAERDRWEFGHAVRAGLLAGALAALVWSTVNEPV